MGLSVATSRRDDTTVVVADGDIDLATAPSLAEATTAARQGSAGGPPLAVAADRPAMVADRSG